MNQHQPQLAEYIKFIINYYINYYIFNLLSFRHQHELINYFILEVINIVVWNVLPQNRYIYVYCNSITSNKSSI